MLTRLSTTLLALCVALPLVADMYTIAPPSGLTSGGTEVTIKKTDGTFGTWSYGVLFGGVPAQSTQRVDEHTLVAVTPEHMPGTVDVAIFEYDMFLSTDLTFTCSGDVPASYERVLLPLLVPPVFGAFGSEFHTDLLFAASGGDVPLWGLEYDRERAQCPPVSACIFPDDPIVAERDPLRTDWVLRNGAPGRFIYVNKDELPNLAMNLRVYDVSRAALNFGTEIPIVREREFVGNDRKIVFLEVPTDPRFRNTLRIYSDIAQTVDVTTVTSYPWDVRTRSLSLKAGANIYEPAFVQFSDFPVGVQWMQVTVELPPLGPISADPRRPFWAFMTTTNNETQMITTMTPQP